MQFVNLTPHTINLNDGTAFAPQAPAARVDASFTPFDENGVCEQAFGDIVNLPAPQDGVTYIVSLIVLTAGKQLGRTDLVAPASGHPLVVRKDGQIVSVPGFVR